MYGDGTIKAISKLENQDITSKAIFIILEEIHFQLDILVRFMQRFGDY